MPPDDILINKAAIDMAMHVIADRQLGVPQIAESGYKDWIRLGESLGVVIRP
jgi:hypothetical protein